VTSRAALNVRGEQCYTMVPLALPTEEQRRSLAALGSVPSVALFLERVSAALPGCTVASLEEGHLIGNICARLDGLPLAIELAAARVKHLGVRELHERLARPAFLGMLSEGPQDLADHQRTMHSTIAWSYELLGESERRLFRWLGVFVAGASLDALLAVSRMSEDSVLGGLAALLDASLLQCVESAGSRRYTQLVTVRAYAQEQLCTKGEWEEAQERFAAYCADFVDILMPNRGNQPERTIPLVEAEYENMRAALAWALETESNARGLRMVGTLRRFWAAQSQYLEGLEWLERFIARAVSPRTDDERAALAEAWTGVLVLSHRLDRFERAREAGESALALQREVGDAALIAGAMQNLANPLGQLRDFERAKALYEECLALYRQLNQRQGMVFPLMNLGELYAITGQPRKALDLYEQSLALSHELGESEWARGLTWNNVGEAYLALDEPARTVEVTEPNYHLFLRQHDVFCTATCAFTLGRAYWRLGDAGTARAHLAEAERLFRTLGNPVMAARVLYVGASMALEIGDIPGARRDLAEALVEVTGQSPESTSLWWLVERAGTLACRGDDPQTAARLYGAAMAHRDATQEPFEPAECEMRARDVGWLHDTLSERELAACFTEGRQMDPASAVEVLRTVLAEEGISAKTRTRSSLGIKGGW
jgi:predicted ATPase